jgi:hypothetical protein
MDREIVEFDELVHVSPRQRITADVKLFLDDLAARFLVDREAAASKLSEQRGFSRARAARKNHPQVLPPLHKRRMMFGLGLILTKHCCLPG